MKNIKFVVLMSVLLLIFSCGTTIQAVKDNPADYRGTVVNLRGQVGKVIGIPLTPFSVFLLSDETGKIPVITRNEHSESKTISGKFYVVALLAEEAAEDGSSNVEELRKYLRDKEILTGKAVDIASSALIKGIQALGSVATGTYFVIEE